MKYDLHGTTMQLLNLQLTAGEKVTAESGRLVYMSDNIAMQAEATGGLFAGLKRKLIGESFFLVSFSCAGGSGMVGFGSEFPGKVIPLPLKKGDEIIAQKDAFLVAEESVTFDASFTRRISAGLLGGEGLLLIKLRGPGLAFMNVGGEVSEIKLKAGEKIRVDTGNLAMFDATVDYAVERVKGVRNLIWGGEGLFLATCTGPGRVWVQSMPVAELAGKLAEYLPDRRGGSLAAGFVAGSLLSGRR
ncbi:MAG: TIGR00266 family protein [Candidatus Aenigmarchaeota archaeon]|nr:TIGR00266 family protein [Candidatus Aenigmarchaeota archaeon]